ncbi:MAG: InlB B-repeat-containing protein [Candidatus Coproplasma sp.]
MRKIRTCIFLILIICISWCAVCASVLFASAETGHTATVTVESKDVRRGQVFTVDVELTETDGLAALMLEIDRNSYDRTAFSLLKAENGDALQGSTFSVTNLNTSYDESDSVRFLWDSTATNGVTGTLLTLTFASYSSTEPQDFDLTLKVVEENCLHALEVRSQVYVNVAKISVHAGAFKAEYYSDGVLLYQNEYDADEEPGYVGETPTRAEDEGYTYEFSEWEQQPSQDDRLNIYHAVYTATPKLHNLYLYVDGELADGYEYYTDQTLDLTVPTKDSYVFCGWYTEQEYLNKFTASKMTAGDLRLYGYFKIDKRDENIPVVQTSVAQDGNDVEVLLEITENTGLVSLVLTLQYDKANLTFTAYKIWQEGLAQLNLATTNTGATAPSVGDFEGDFKFYYDGFSRNENDYTTGKMLTLYFTINDEAPKGLYEIGFEYMEGDKPQATYLTEEKQNKYTDVLIGSVYAEKGRLDCLEDETDGVRIKIETDGGFGLTKRLEITDVTGQYVATRLQDAADVMENTQQIKSVYDIRLFSNDIEVQPDGKLQITLTVGENPEQYSYFVYDENNKLQALQYTVNGDKIVFESTRLGELIVVENVEGYAPGTGNAGTNHAQFYLIISLILVVFSLFLYMMIRLKKKNKNNDG